MGLKLNVEYGVAPYGFKLLREGYHLKIISKEPAVRLREWHVREVGLVQAIKQRISIAEKQGKPHLVQRYQYILTILGTAQQALRDGQCA